MFRKTGVPDKGRERDGRWREENAEDEEMGLNNCRGDDDVGEKVAGGALRDGCGPATGVAVGAGTVPGRDHRCPRRRRRDVFDHAQHGHDIQWSTTRRKKAPDERCDVGDSRIERVGLRRELGGHKRSELQESASEDWSELLRSEEYALARCRGAVDAILDRRMLPASCRIRNEPFPQI